MPPTDDLSDLRQKLAHAEAVIAELRGVVADLRTQIEAQQAHIHRLVKLTFGRGGERVEGPTLFDALDPSPDSFAVPTDPTTAVPTDPTVPEASVPTDPTTAASDTDTPKRPGHGRRRKPADLPRRREEIDLSDAEKVCGCCGTTKIRIGQSASERLDYTLRGQN